MHFTQIFPTSIHFRDPIRAWEEFYLCRMWPIQLQRFSGHACDGPGARSLPGFRIRTATRIDDASDRSDPVLVNSYDLRQTGRTRISINVILLNISYIYQVPNIARLVSRIRSAEPTPELLFRRFMNRLFGAGRFLASQSFSPEPLIP